MLRMMEIPYAYHHFEVGDSIAPPFLVYLLPESNNFSADGVVYYGTDILHIELYTDKKDIVLEKKIENVLKRCGLFWQKSETWIESEMLYEVLYQTEV